MRVFFEHPVPMCSTPLKMKQECPAQEEDSNSRQEPRAYQMEGEFCVNGDSKTMQIANIDDFRCVICLELVYKPIVQSCGHIFCFWCNHGAMNFIGVSHCALCREPFSHFRRVCELLHFLLLKLFPVEYMQRAEEILEEERQKNTFSPQLSEHHTSISMKNLMPDDLAMTPNHVVSESLQVGAASDSGKGNCAESDDLPSLHKESESAGPDNEMGMSLDGHNVMDRITVDDALCLFCKKLLHFPSVLNCGHVYCNSCITSSNGRTVSCKVCRSVNPGDKPSVCLVLHNFLKQAFPSEYEEQRKPTCQLSMDFTISSGSTSSGEPPVDIQTEDHQQSVTLHIRVGCDDCGAYPITGKRYKCCDCTEDVGFDLCETCYERRGVNPGRFNQQHTAEHKFMEDSSKAYSISREFMFKGVRYLWVD